MRISALWAHRAIIVLGVLFFSLTQAYSFYLMTYEGPDEDAHTAYILWILQHGALPDARAQFDSAMHQEASQNPLYYSIVAAYGWLSRVDTDVTVAPVRNPWRTDQGTVSLYDNRNHFMMNPQNHIMPPSLRDQAALVRALRQPSPFFGIAALIAVYVSGLTLWPRRYAWATLAAMLFALNPMIIQTFSVISNDIGAITFGTWAMFGMLRLRRQPESRGWLIFTGIMTGLAAFSKSSGALLIPVSLLPLLMSWRAAGAGRGMRLAKQAALMLVTIFIAGGWWYVWMLVRYGDPLGAFNHTQMSWGAEGPSLLTFPQIARTLVSTWADFGWGGGTTAPWWIMSVPLILIVASIIGGLRQKSRPDADRVLLGAIVITGAAGLAAWSFVSVHVPGRLFFISAGAGALLITSGLMHWPRLKSIWAALMGMSAVAVIPLVLIPAFGTPRLYPDSAPPPDLIGTPLDAGGVAFLGYRIDSDTIDNGSVRRMTLCWRPPDPRDSERYYPMPWAFTLQILSPQYQVIAQRDSYFGMGNYTAWRFYSAFCDTFEITITGGVQAGENHPLLVRLYDPATMAAQPSYDASGALNELIGTVKGASAP